MQILGERPMSIVQCNAERNKGLSNKVLIRSQHQQDQLSASFLLTKVYLRPTWPIDINGFRPNRK